MSEEIRVNRPGQSLRPDGSPLVSPELRERTGSSGSSRGPWVILGIIILILVLGSILFRDKLFGAKNSVMSGVSTKSGGYQAVFLTNGQVYFGKISSTGSDYVTLNDIYYLQVVQPPLQGTTQAGQTPPATGQQPQISLVKLGNELHGPVDEMHISRAQILFYEDLKNDGNVVKAIDAYKANPSGTPAK